VRQSLYKELIEYLMVKGFTRKRTKDLDMRNDLDSGAEKDGR